MHLPLQAHSTTNPSDQAQTTKGSPMTSTLIKRRNTSDEGFTLIEMLIVIIILGLLTMPIRFISRC